MKKILVVDDDPLIVDVIAEKLSTSGYEVLKATDGVEAVRLAKINQPDLIILDLLMPIMGGAGAVIALKEDKKTKKIPIFFLTGADLSEDEMKRDHVGADQIFHKPFSLQELMEKIREVLSKKR